VPRLLKAVVARAGVPLVESDDVRPKFDNVAIEEPRGRRERLSIQGDAGTNAEIFKNEAAVALPEDSCVFNRYLTVHWPHKRQRQMLGSP
jgi:hypothetical protein